MKNKKINIKISKEDDNEDPDRLAHFNTYCNDLEKPIIVLHSNRINDYIKKLDNEKKVEYLIELIIFHELSHWFIESFFSTEISGDSKQQLYFHEALAQYFTHHLLSIDKDNEKKVFFEWFCFDKYSNNEEKKKIYNLWKIDETDKFELINYELYSVIDAIKECNKQNKQDWEFLKEILIQKKTPIPNYNVFGPFHFSDFTQNGTLRKDAANAYPLIDEKGNQIPIPNPNHPGVYIWGNLFDIDKNGELLFPTDCTSQNFKYNPKKHQFVPYYVGKIESSIFKRLIQHSQVRLGNAVGYIRFSFDYWKEFFKDPLYERDSNSLINLVNIKKNSVTYHNDKAVLQEIYPQMNIVPAGSNHPITAQNLYGNPLTDTLDMVVNGANNFWFCYCPVNINRVKILGQLETQVFYSLKGKTTSKKDKCPSVVLTNILDKTNNSKIFKKIEYIDGSELIFPHEAFWGY